MDVLKKVPVREQDPKVRATNFNEVCLGYNFEEASQIALNIFDNSKNDKMPIEFYINKVSTKEDWLKDQKRYGYLFQGGMKSYPTGY
jgi:hypothetical protein